MKYLKYLFQSLMVFLITGITSSLSLLLLVITDPYFKNLDFKLNDFKVKIVTYLLFTSTIPIVVTIILGLFYFFKVCHKTKDKILSILAMIVGIILFQKFDNLIKKNLFFTESIIFFLLTSIFLYSIILLILYKQERKLISIKF